MSDFVPLVAPKGHSGRHRHSRSAAASEPSSNVAHPQNPHHLNNMNSYRDNTHAITHQFQPSTPPRTPRRPDQNIPPAKNMGSATVVDNSSKQRSKNKNKPRKSSASPHILNNERVSPPLTGVSLSTETKGAKPIPTPVASAPAAAYAGPTFHASPAPSALPIPSFYSKSVPDSPAPVVLQSMKEETSSDSSNSPTPPTSQSTSVHLQREESPLEIFFKKDRAEKARARGSSSASGPFQPPDSPHSTHTPMHNQDRSRSGHFAGGSGSRMFGLELDGNNSPGKPYGPAFSTPYNQRMDAARSVTAPSPNAGRGLEDARDIQTSQALKDFLFTGQSPRSPAVSGNQSSNTSPYSSTPPNFPHSTSTSSSPHNGPPRNAGIPSRTYYGQSDFAYLNNSNPSILRSSGLRQEVSHTVTPTKTPEHNRGYYNSSTPSRVAGNNFPALSSSHNQFFAAGSPGSPYGTPPPQRGADLQGMEESLRRILKLDSSSSSLKLDSSGSSIGVGGLGHLPAAAASVPNYVGGRAPPMNGMHNGVMGS